MVYGINTGFGLLAQTSIPREQLATLQRNLILSHSTGVGTLLGDEVVKLILVLKIIGLCRGHSGTRLKVIEALIALVEHKVFPCIPSKGSVGASGDLAPLAHLAAALLGVGQVRHQNKTIPAQKGLEIAGLKPLELAPKEGLAFINGTQVSTALALMGLFGAERNFAAGLLAGAMSLDGFMGTDRPFDERIHQARGQVGQIAVAKVLRNLLKGSKIRESHRNCTKVQDPYSLRCQPQVMGAALDILRGAAQTLEIESNAATDNPLIFPQQDQVLSGGNFHAEPVAMAADIMAIAIAEMGAISERRIALLIDPHMSDLPPFLVKNSGVNSGFMIAQVTAASLASENKSLAHPASVDSMPTSANQEDHVSMATFAGRRLLEMNANTAGIIAVELLAACQAIEFREPYASSPTIGEAMKLIRTGVPPYEEDRYFAPDIEFVTNLIQQGTFTQWVPGISPANHKNPWAET